MPVTRAPYHSGTTAAIRSVATDWMTLDAICELLPHIPRETIRRNLSAGKSVGTVQMRGDVGHKHRRSALEYRATPPAEIPKPQMRKRELTPRPYAVGFRGW